MRKVKPEAPVVEVDEDMICLLAHTVKVEPFGKAGVRSCGSYRGDNSDALQQEFTNKRNGQMNPLAPKTSAVRRRGHYFSPWLRVPRRSLRVHEVDASGSVLRCARQTISAPSIRHTAEVARLWVSRVSPANEARYAWKVATHDA